ncbi:MAG: hypothetical protein N4A74_25495 [Carboxylicivirga sp.]|jgi:hypothetical protein|nr:hypothetical protein [Carboxylicivirga sp.]
MKNVIIILLILIGYTANAQVGGIVSDPKRDFRQSMEWVETKAKWVEDKAHNAASIQKLREQLIKLQEMKENLDKSYKLVQDAYDEATKYGSLINAGVPGLIYGLENVVEMPLNPASYIPNMGGNTKKVKSMMYYNPSSNVNSDARFVIKDILGKSQTLYRTNENGEEVAYKELAVTDAFKELTTLQDILKSASKKAEEDAIAMQFKLANELEHMAKEMSEKLLNGDKLNMTHAERMNMLLKCNDMNREAKNLRQDAIKDLQEQIANDVMPEDKYWQCRDKAINYTMNQVFFKADQYKVRNKHYSLWEYERKRKR